MARKMLFMSQEKLGKALGVTFQQVQKYENGTSRVVAGRLEQMAKALQVPVSFFFEDPSGEDKRSPDYVTDFLITTDGLALAKAFSAIKDLRVGSSVVNLMKAIVDEEE
jgi:transcriptional regulator with XRE-family HTH domain